MSARLTRTSKTCVRNCATTRNSRAISSPCSAWAINSRRTKRRARHECLTHASPPPHARRGNFSDMPRPSLFVRLMGAFVLVILVAIVVVSVIVNQTTTSEFRQFMFQGAMVRIQDLTDELAAYYRARGSWDGVEALFAQGGQVYGSMSEMMSRGMMSGMMSASASNHVMLADARGIVVADTLPGHAGETVSPTLLATGTPIQVNGQTVGTLVVEGDMMSGFD